MKLSPLPVSFLVPVLLFPFLSIAQSSFDFQGGMHWSDAIAYNRFNFNATPQANLFAGISYRAPLRGRWAVNCDLQYTGRGFLYHAPDPSERYRLDYVDFASKIEYRVYENIGFLLGSYVGYRFAEYTDSGASGQWIKRLYPLSVNWDMGFQTGVVANFYRWTAFIRYHRGIFPVVHEYVYRAARFYDILNLYNQGLQIGCSISLLNR